MQPILSNTDCVLISLTGISVNSSHKNTNTIYIYNINIKIMKEEKEKAGKSSLHAYSSLAGFSS